MLRVPTMSCIVLLYLTLMSWSARSLALVTNTASTHRTAKSSSVLAATSDADIMVRAFKGEKVDRTPVWLMRQAGRYMADFRKYSEKYPFRMRSETPEIAIELSLQPWKTFGVDAVIMFSDILTPLPAMGIDFTIVEGKGPKIAKPIRSAEDVFAVRPLHDVETQVPFLGPILRNLRKETEGKTSLIGFIGAPWTLAAYSVEGGHSKLCAKMKMMMNDSPEIVHALLDKYTDSLCLYASYQIQSGAQILQVFESWAHHLTEEQFLKFAKPQADKISAYLKQRHPEVPTVYFANGGSCYLHAQTDMKYDALSIDWRISMTTAKRIAGSSGKVLAGNVDPMVLYSSEEVIRKAVETCIREANGKHVLNLGHGVEKDTPESSVAALVNAAKSIKI